MKNTKIEYWCRNCQTLFLHEPFAPEDLDCPFCGDHIWPFDQYDPNEQEAVRYIEWCRSVLRRDEWGPTPTVAAKELGCTRSMIDHLVRAGVLIRSEFKKDCKKSKYGFNTVVISQQSIYAAMRNRDETGNWTGGSKKKS